MKFSVFNDPDEIDEEEKGSLVPNRMPQRADLQGIPKKRRITIESDDEEDVPVFKSSHSIMATANSPDVEWVSARDALKMDPRVRLQNQQKAREDNKIKKKGNIFAQFSANTNIEVEDISDTPPNIGKSSLARTASRIEVKRQEKTLAREQRRSNRGTKSASGSRSKKIG